MPTFGSLFAGIGGIDLGLERAGWQCIWQVEIDPFRRAILAKHWPDVPKYGAIEEVDLEQLEVPDLIAGGFPCQPVSAAGRRKAQADPRWLWPQFARVVAGLRPRYVLVENVPGLLTRGLGFILADLSALRYDAEWDCVSASALGAPHIRNRIWLVAYADSARRYWREGEEQPVRRPPLSTTRSGRRGEVVADSASNGLPAPLPQGVARQEGSASQGRCLAHSDGESSVGPPVARQEQHPWKVEPAVGRVADGVPARVDRIRALGDAVVPQVAEYIGRRILETTGISD